MCCKAILVAATVLLFTQFIHARQISISSNFQALGVESRNGTFVSINGTSYYIDSTKDYSRDEAAAECQSVGMHLITFETREKWIMIKDWMRANNYTRWWFWTDAVREAFSPVWYWERTGEELTEFFWSLTEPDIVNNDIRTCIDFCHKAGGYYDSSCTPSVGSQVICQDE